VQISKNYPFSSIVQTINLDSDILTTDANELADGKYYWHVRAINTNDENGIWSSYRYFTVDTTPQEIPKMTSPENGDTQTTIPKLTVSSVSGAKYYQFQVALEETFASPVVDVTKTTTYYNLTSAQALPFGTAYWRVQSIDAAGNLSGWSEPRSFVVSIQKMPTNLSYTTNTKPAFSWTAVSGAQQYQIQMDEAEDFSSPEIDEFLPPSTSYTTPTALTYTGTCALARLQAGQTGHQSGRSQ
jgi:hypothetical protein